MSNRRLLLLATLVTLVIVALALDLPSYLTLQAVQESLARWTEWRARHPVTAIAAFFIGYMVVVALSIPGAAVMTLLAGALFGLIGGTLIVSFASTLGATVAFLASRYLFREAIKKRYAKRLAAIDAGLERDGPFYLFTLRLVPIFPFFLINLIMGITKMPTLTFYWVSQLGMLPGTLVYVNAGRELARLDSVGDVLSPRIAVSLAALAVFPWIARIAVRGWQRRKRYRGWARPERYDSNLLVIGAGAAGLVTAYIGAAVKAKVTLIQAGPMGGDCLNTGCVPSKTLIRAARIADELRTAEHYGIANTGAEIDFRAVIARVQATIDRISVHDSEARYRSLGVEVINGHAQLTSPWTVEISGPDGSVETRAAPAIVLATGAKPIVPPIPGIEQSGYVTSDTLWGALAQFERAPTSMVVLGAGPIGCELAQALARLDAGVTLVEMGPRVLPSEDDDVAALAAEGLRASGVTVLTEHRAVRCERDTQGPKIVVEGPDGEKVLRYDLLLVAVGRTARTEGFGLERLGVPAGCTIETNEYLQTIFPNIYVAGDAAGPWQFTHAGAHQAWYAAVNALFGRLRRFKVDERVMPRVTFLDPEIARVGLNELEASKREVAFEVTRYDLDDLDRAIADGTTCGFVKVLTPPNTDRILGATIVGSHAGEMLTEFTFAMKHGHGLNAILGTVHPYPTLSEANKYAAGVWKKAHQPERALALLERVHAWRRSRRP